MSSAAFKVCYMALAIDNVYGCDLTNETHYKKKANLLL